MMPICKLVPAGNLTPNPHVSGGGEVVIPLQRVDDPYTNIKNLIVVYLIEMSKARREQRRLVATELNNNVMHQDQ